MTTAPHQEYCGRWKRDTSDADPVASQDSMTIVAPAATEGDDLCRQSKQTSCRSSRAVTATICRADERPLFRGSADLTRDLIPRLVARRIRIDTL